METVLAKGGMALEQAHEQLSRGPGGSSLRAREPEDDFFGCPRLALEGSRPEDDAPVDWVTVWATVGEG